MEDDALVPITVGVLQSQIRQMQVAIDQLTQLSNANTRLIEWFRQELNFSNKRSAAAHAVLMGYAARLRNLETSVQNGNKQLTSGLLQASIVARPAACDIASVAAAPPATAAPTWQIVNLEDIGSLSHRRPSTESSKDSVNRKRARDSAPTDS